MHGSISMGSPNARFAPRNSLMCKRGIVLVAMKALDIDISPRKIKRKHGTHAASNERNPAMGNMVQI